MAAAAAKSLQSNAGTPHVTLTPPGARASHDVFHTEAATTLASMNTTPSYGTPRHVGLKKGSKDPFMTSSWDENSIYASNPSTPAEKGGLPSFKKKASIPRAPGSGSSGVSTPAKRISTIDNDYDEEEITSTSRRQTKEEHAAARRKLETDSFLFHPEMSNNGSPTPIRKGPSAHRNAHPGRWAPYSLSRFEGTRNIPRASLQSAAQIRDGRLDRMLYNDPKNGVRLTPRETYHIDKHSNNNAPSTSFNDQNYSGVIPPVPARYTTKETQTFSADSTVAGLGAENIETYGDDGSTDKNE